MNQDNTNIKFWERYAKLYIMIIEKTNRKMYKELCMQISNYLNKNITVLELACGSGQITSPLANKVKLWEATDFSKNMLDETRKRVKDTNVIFSRRDATKLPYEDESIDVVVISNALHIMPNADKALAEIRRVLKKDGLLIAPTFVFEGRMSKLLLWIAEKMGHHVFTKWTSDQYEKFVCQRNFIVETKTVIQGNLQPVCLLVCKK